VGPNNIAFASPQISFKYNPLNVSAGDDIQLCPSTTGQLLGSATSPMVPGTTTASQTHGNHPTQQLSSVSINSESSCALDFSVTIPDGAVISGINVSYQMRSTQISSSFFGDVYNTGFQRSYVECISPGGTKEASVTSGNTTSLVAFSSAATQTYTRNNLNIANGVVGGGTIDFRLHAFRTQGGTGCEIDPDRINANTVSITVTYTFPPDM
jgi:hypothetical protein